LSKRKDLKMTFNELTGLTEMHYTDLLGGTLKNLKTGKELIIGGSVKGLVGIVPDKWLVTDQYHSVDNLVFNQMLDDCPANTVSESKFTSRNDLRSDFKSITEEDIQYIYFEESDQYVPLF
jgi:hypothetical protein